MGLTILEKVKPHSKDKITKISDFTAGFFVTADKFR